MKLLIQLLLLYSFTLSAQVKTLPYKNEFATPADGAAFKSIRTGVTKYYDWRTVSYASHDYPVGGQTSDTVSDWLFSPAIKVTSGAVLSFKYGVYAIMGSATATDEFSVWYGKNDMNPNNGTFVKIADFTNKASSVFNDWKDTSGIVLPFAADSGYVVFRYKATTNWFTVGVDSIVVKMPGLSVPDTYLDAEITLSPNPVTNELYISTPVNIESVEIVSMDGKCVYTSTLADQRQLIDIAGWENGIYMIRIKTASGVVSRTFVKS